jgi:alkylated DNA repair protein alkB homolog 8
MDSLDDGASAHATLVPGASVEASLPPPQADANMPLSIVDYVTDDSPSCFLRCTMSRRIPESLVTEDKLRPYLVGLLRDAPSDAIQSIHYGKSARRVILVHVATRELAASLREQLHETPCALINQRIMYVEFAMPRKEKEARDAFLRVTNISRIRSLEDPSARIPGLVFLPEFITREQETALLTGFDSDDRVRWKRTVKARQVQHYGFEFNYDTRRCDETQPLPEPMPAALQQLIDDIPVSVMGATPDQITVNEYLPGQGIAAHIDTHSAFTNAIASLSLGSEIVMEFRHPDESRPVESVLLPPRSLLVMTGASRYEWTHAIPPRLFDVIDGQRVDRQRRVSITFRKVQSTACTCDFPVQCDAQDREQQRLLARQAQAEKEHEECGSLAPTLVEQQYVHQFYETVATHFSSTRYNPWPRVAAFVRGLEPGAWVADIGCGNGKYMKCVDATQSLVVGGDRSSKLVEICHTRGLNAMVCDALSVPIRSRCCDAALSIAVLHHLSTLHHRVTAVKEVVRVLRVGGRGVIYAWAHEQKANSKRRFDEAKQDFMVPWNLDKRFAGTADTKEDVTEETTAPEPIVVQRYCHMFKQGELESLVTLAGDAVVEDSYYDESNWAVVLRRVS